MEKGDIFKAIDRKNHKHPIVFLEALSREKFTACILSTKGTKGNIKMSKNHFFTQDKNGKNYTITFDNSHLVPGRVFEKEVIWLSSKEPCGKLTQEGIKFVDEHTSDAKPEYHPIPIWENKI